MTLTTFHIDELLDRCRHGDQRAQMTIYRKYSRAMYNTALRIVKDSAEAEDIVQECFLKAFEKLHTYEGTSTFGAWLKRIVVNYSINIFRKNQKYQSVSYEDKLKYTIDDEQDGIGSTEQENNQGVLKILKAMNTLKENYRVALTLHLIEGYDYEEMCEILDISYANCRTTVSRAKESLRKKLEKL